VHEYDDDVQLALMTPATTFTDPPTSTRLFALDEKVATRTVELDHKQVIEEDPRKLIAKEQTNEPP
jgi:hypothetical protein